MNRTFKILSAALTFGLAAQANIITTTTSITASGPNYLWTYDMQLSNDQNVNAGLAPTVNLVPPTNLSFGGFTTLYDFAGYIPGSCTGPAGWTCTAQLAGFTPADVIPVDNPNIVNITWAYTSGPTIVGQPLGVDLGLFKAVSAYSTPTQVSYASRGVKNIGSQAGTISDNVGNTSAPSAVPEPASAVILGGGLVGLALLGRRRLKTA